MLPLAAFMCPQLAAVVVWVDYRRTALMPRTGGLGVVPTSAHTEMKADTQATERPAWVENCEQRARLC